MTTRSRKPKRNQSPHHLAPRATILGVSIFLIAITWLVFGETLRHPFINLDDPEYVFENPKIITGLTSSGMLWAFTHFHGGNWHPLTSISHMLDCQFFGLQAGWHHFTNVLLHTVAVVLLFVVFREMTGALWRSAFLAAVFRGVAASGPERCVAVFAKVERVTLCAPKNGRQRSAVPTVSSSAMSVPVDLLFRSPRISVD